MTDADIYVQWGVALAVAIFMFARGQFTLFHPSVVYLGFHIVVFCLRPTFVHFFDFNSMFEYMQIRPTRDDMSLALYASSAGLIAFVAGFTVAIRNAPPLKLKGRVKLTAEDRRAFYITAAIFVPLGIYSIVAGDLSGHVVNGVWVLTGSTGYINDLQQVFIPITILLILVARWKWWSYIPFLGYVAFRATQGLARWTIVLSVFLIILVWLWDHRRRFPPLRFLIPLPFLFILFVNVSHDRNLILRYFEGSTKEDRVSVLDDTRSFQEKWDTSDFANFDFLTYIVKVVPDYSETYTFGTQYLQLFTEPIPRVLWKNKPAGPPIEFFNLNDYGNFYGMTPSLVGDGWMSFGWLGVCITLGAAGVALGIVFKLFARKQNFPRDAFAFLICNAVIVQLFRDGGITIFKFLLFTMAPVFLWSRLSSHFQAQRELVDGLDDDNDEGDFEIGDDEDDKSYPEGFLEEEDYEEEEDDWEEDTDEEEFDEDDLMDDELGEEDVDEEEDDSDSRIRDDRHFPG